MHTCYSHDAYCCPTDDNTGPETAYSSLGTVGERFAEAKAKGLDFLEISDHDDTRAWGGPARAAAPKRAKRPRAKRLRTGDRRHLASDRNEPDGKPRLRALGAGVTEGL